MPTIQTRNLTRRFRVKKEIVEAVRGIDIEVRGGEKVTLLGPNGAGTIGVPAALRRLAHTPGNCSQQLPELCLPNLFLNDADFAAAIDAVERGCRCVGLPTEPPAPMPDLHPDR